MDGDVILHMCELVCSPLGDSFTLVPRMSETCKRLHTLLRPILHELRPAVRAISALEALGCPRWTLRERCLRLSIALREDEAFCYANDAFYMQNAFTRVHGPSFRIQEKAERLLATLLPHRAFHHLAALRIMGDVPGYVFPAEGGFLLAEGCVQVDRSFCVACMMGSHNPNPNPNVPQPLL